MEKLISAYEANSLDCTYLEYYHNCEKEIKRVNNFIACAARNGEKEIKYFPKSKDCEWLKERLIDNGFKCKPIYYKNIIGHIKHGLSIAW